MRADLRMHARANYQIKSIFFIIKSKEAGSQSEFLNRSMDSGCQSSGFRGIHQKSRSAILQRFFAEFLREDVVEKSMSIWSGARASAALISLGRVAER